MSAVKLPVLVFLCCCALVGCSHDTTTASGGGATASTTGGPKGPEPKVVTEDVVVGKDKRVAEAGDTAYMLYRGTLKNGKEFDSNMKPGKEIFVFTVGQGQVIKGWDQGIVGMHPGGERKLHVPAALGYGSEANGPIPANSDLDFDVKLLGLVKVGEEAVVEKTDVKPGTGDRIAKPGDKVTIQYIGTLLDGKVFEDSHKKEPYTFTLGKGETLTCIDAAVTGMKVGGVRKIVAPPQTAYVSQNSAGVPANSVVNFEIELVSIK
jgi:FKBP-type peptidyl-prolyl cis-trans isomerase